MHIFYLLFFVFILSGHAQSNTTAATKGNPFSVEEFRELVGLLAPKVNLFRDVWAAQPDAEFYGGSARDFEYWVKGKFRGIDDRAKALQVRKELLDLVAIDIREFVVGDSDVDIAVKSKYVSLSSDSYGIRKFDFKSKNLFDPATKEGMNEILQGYLPVEKIRIGRKGVIDWPQMGDGTREIWEGKPTAHFATAEDFKRSYYAKKNLNHPILLALRYLRILAVNYFQNKGQGYPDKEILFDIDPDSMKQTLGVIEKAAQMGELDPFESSDSFWRWSNGSIRKSFRSYTNSTAALLLMQKFKVDQLVKVYKNMDPFNQYVFVKKRDQKKILEIINVLGLDPIKIFQPVSKYFANFKYYHGTSSDENALSILMQGVLPSEGGSAGAGLYGVAEKNLDFAIKWRNSGEKNVVVFTLDPELKLLDITEGEGEVAWQRYQLQFPDKNLDAFAEDLGIDIIRYSYDVEAFVVKNAGVLLQVEGYKRKVRKLSEVFKEARSIKGLDDFMPFIEDLSLSLNLTPNEWRQIFLATGKIDLWLNKMLPKPFIESNNRFFWKAWFKSKLWMEQPKTIDPLIKLVFEGNENEKKWAMKTFYKIINSNSSAEWKALEHDQSTLQKLKDTVFQLQLKSRSVKKADAIYHRAIDSVHSEFWMLFPRELIRLIKNFIDSADIDTSVEILSSYMFTNLPWSKHPEVVVQIVPEFWNILNFVKFDNVLLNHMLIDFSWSQYPDFFLEFCQRLPDRLLPWFSSQIDLAKFTANQYDTVIAKAISIRPELSASILNSILVRTPDNSDLFTKLLLTILEETKQDSLIASRILSRPGSENQLKVLIELINRNHSDWAIDRFVLSQPGWQEKIKNNGLGLKMDEPLTAQSIRKLLLSKSCDQILAS